MKQRINQRTEIHTHSYFSLLDSLPSPTELVENAVKKGLKSIALTDHGWLGGMAEFFLSAKKNNIKPIYGVEAYETTDTLNKDKTNRYYHLIILAKNNNGMKNLNKIVQRSTLEENFYYKPRIQIDWLEPFAEDIVISSACMAGRINKLEKWEEKIDFVNEMKSKFPNFYIELQSHDVPEQKTINLELVEIAKQTDIPIVITCDVHYKDKEDALLHGKFKALTGRSKQTPDEIGEIYKDCYIQTVDEIYEKLNYLPEDVIYQGIKNSNDIADMCNVTMDFDNLKFPKTDIPSEFKSEREFIEHRIEEGWKYRGYDLKSLEIQAQAKDRIKYELDVIESKGFLSYFIIVDDFLKYNDSQGFLPPRGRGSVAGCFIAYLMRMHDIDSLEYDLIFERFLNPDKNDTHIPDIDVDFIHTGRQQIVDYCSDKYGYNKVGNVGLYSYIQTKTAIKDIGKSLDIPYTVTNVISKDFSDNNKFKLKDFVKEGKHLKWVEKYNEYPIQELFETASQIQGIPKSFGSHPSGKIICDRNLNEELGMANVKGENVCMYDMNFVEKLGFIKFDFLGLKTSTVIYDTLKLIGKDFKYVETSKLNLKDDKVFKEFRDGNTSGIFQFSSYGMREVLKKMQVDCIEDLLAANALYRPGAMDYIDTFCHNKKNPEDIEYVHEDLKNILGVTYGQLVYQEQMMSIGKLANIPSVDDLRRACGKKKIELMDEQEAYLKTGLINRGWSQEQADKIWEQIVLFASYSFNKSHAAAYAVVAYITMYLKVYHPIEFMTSLLNVYGDDNEAVSVYVVEAQRIGINIKPPNINKSEREFVIDGDSILFGLDKISQCGGKLADKIIEERNANGSFLSFSDFYKRIKVDKGSIVALIKAGAFGIKNKKDFLLKYAESLYETKEYTSVVSLPTLKVLEVTWGIVEKDKQKRLELYNEKRKVVFENKKSQDFKEHIEDFKNKYMASPEMWEFETMNMFLTYNPLKKYSKYITEFGSVKNGNEATVIGVIATVQKKVDRNKKQFAFLDVYQNGILTEVVVWHTQYKQYLDLISRGNVLVMIGKKSEEKLVLSKAQTLESWVKYNLNKEAK